MLKQASRKPSRRPASPPEGIAAGSAVTASKPGILQSQTFWLGMAGALLLWGAFPPLNWPWLAWIAPVPWLWLARLPELPGQRPYLALWLAGSAHWLAMLYGIRMAHPALNAGWVAVAVYLGIYLPLFVGLTRVAIHRLGVSLVVAGPIVWVGLELLRGHLVTGFSLALLAHTQAEWPVLIQISDLAGGYALSLVVMLVAACLAQMLPLPLNAATPLIRRLSWWPIAPAAVAVGLTVGYGSWRLNQPVPGQAGPTANVALIQGSLDTIFITDREQLGRRIAETFEQYNGLTEQAVTGHPNLDLVIWPESMFMLVERQVEEPLSPPPEAKQSAEQMRANIAAAQDEFEYVLEHQARLVNRNTSADQQTLFLFGSNAAVYGSGKVRSYNAAQLADREGKLVGHYYKTHAVMFGEYIPFGAWFPFLYRLTPMEGGLSLGDGPRSFDVAGLALSPSICFESTVPHLIRRQVLELSRQRKPADVLVNLTNDGWFWGSAILDLHQRCSIFRAVENRKPMIVAANTGISTWVDGNGVVRAKGPKRQAEVLVAAVQADGRASPYHAVGDWPAWLCAIACVGLGIVGLRRTRQPE